jgi:hypothetical protein
MSWEAVIWLIGALAGTVEVIRSSRVAGWPGAAGWFAVTMISLGLFVATLN